MVDAAPMAAALLASYARQRMHVNSAGEVPGAGSDEVVVVVRALADAGIDASEAFPKPLTDDAVRAADVIVVLAAAPLTGLAGRPADTLLRWDIPELENQSYDVVQAARDDLDRRVLRLLADVLTPTSPP